MTLSTGTKLSHYEITSQIGKGGMGEVYQATDTKLGRPVAIKVLPEEFAKDTDRVARFQREAKLLASLNHPNIAAIYGLEESDGTNFLVMELVEGQTLDDRIKSGSIPVEEALKLALQIAEALEAAHEKGVIHRDLKPTNIKVTPDGKVKVLDFGLAKAFAGEQADLNLSNSPTLSVAATQQGVILGTAAYMSPEQARGKEVDKRADIWAFGVVLFEMLTGKQVFTGDTVSDTLASVLAREPEWQSLPQNLHPRIRLLLERSLKKELKDRYSGISDARVDIQEVLADPNGVFKQTPALAEGRSKWQLVFPWVAAAVIVAAIIIVVAVWKLKPTEPRQVVMTTIPIEPGHWLAGMQTEMQRPSRTAMAISSDGKFLVYSAIEENPGPQSKPQLYLRKMDQPEAKPIPGTEGGINPFLSPDNKRIGFWADNKLKTIPVEGGIANPLSEVRLLYGADWGRDNSILFSSGWSSGLLRISAKSGKTETLTEPDPEREEFGHFLPSWIDDGKAVLFTVLRYTKDVRPSVALLRMDTREWQILLQDAADARYLPTGHLVFLRHGTLMAVRFDLAKLETVGQPIPIVGNVMQELSGDIGLHTCAGQFDLSETGSLIYVAGGISPEPKNSLVWMDQRGMEQPVTPRQHPFGLPRLSPDGQRIAYIAGLEGHVCVYDLNRGTNIQVTREGQAIYPIWAPDSDRILFAWQKSVALNLFWQPFDGSMPMERLLASEYAQLPGSWSADGKTVAFVEYSQPYHSGIAILDVSSGQVTSILKDPSINFTHPEFSPDGHWIAYSSNESNRSEVYVRPFPGPGKIHQISSYGGTSPLWAKDGRQLFYRRLGAVWVVDVRTDGGLVISRPRKLFEAPGYQASSPIRAYDLSHEGRFLMVKLEQRNPTPVTEMNLIQNWFEELKEKLPVD